MQLKKGNVKKTKSVGGKFPSSRHVSSHYIPPPPINELLRAFVMHCLTRGEDLREARRALCFNAVRFTPEEAARMNITVPEAGISPIPDEQVTRTLLSISLQEEYRIQKETLLLEQLGEADPLLSVPLHSAGRFDSAEVSSARLKATETLQKGVLDVTQSLLTQAAEAADASNAATAPSVSKPKNSVFDPVNHYPTCRKLAILHSCVPKLEGYESPLAMLGHQLASARSVLSSTVASAQARRPPGSDLDALLLDLRADRGVARSMLRLAGTIEKTILSRIEAEGMARAKLQRENSEGLISISSNSTSSDSIAYHQSGNQSSSAVIVTSDAGNFNNNNNVNSGGNNTNANGGVGGGGGGEVRSKAAPPLIRPKEISAPLAKKTTTQQQGAQAIRRQARSESIAAGPPPWRQKADNSLIAAYGKGNGKGGLHADPAIKASSKLSRIQQIPALDLNNRHSLGTSESDSLDPQLRLKAGNLNAAREALYTAGSTESVSPMHPNQGAVNIPLTITGLPGEPNKQIGIVPVGTGQYELQLQRMNMQLQFQKHLDSLQTQAFTSSPSQGSMTGTTSFATGRYTTLTDVVPPPQTSGLRDSAGERGPMLNSQLSVRLSTGSSMQYGGSPGMYASSPSGFGGGNNAIAAAGASFNNPTSPFAQNYGQQLQPPSSYSFENSTLSNAVADARARLGMLSSSSSYTSQSQRLLSAMAAATSTNGNATPGGTVVGSSSALSSLQGIPGSTSTSGSGFLSNYTNPYASASSMSASGLTPRRLDPLNLSGSVIASNHNSPKDRLQPQTHSVIDEEPAKESGDKELEEEDDDLKAKLSQLRIKSKQQPEIHHSLVVEQQHQHQSQTTRHEPHSSSLTSSQIVIHHPLSQEELHHKEVEERIKKTAAARSIQKNLRRMNKLSEKRKKLQGTGFSSTTIRVTLDNEEEINAGHVICRTMLKRSSDLERARKKELAELRARRLVKAKALRQAEWFKENEELVKRASVNIDDIEVFDEENISARNALQKKLDNDAKKAVEAAQVAASKLSPTQASFKLPRDFITVLSDSGNEVVGYLDTRTGHRQREHPNVKLEQKEIAKRTAVHLTMFDEATRQKRKEVEARNVEKKEDRLNAVDTLYQSMVDEEEEGEGEAGGGVLNHEEAIKLKKDTIKIAEKLLEYERRRIKS
jgi:hypothetical protein